MCATSSQESKRWCGRGNLNYCFTLIIRNLLILHSAQRPKCPTIPLPLYVYGTANVSQKRKPRRSVFSQSCQQQFDIRPSHRSRPRATVRECGMGSVLRSLCPDRAVDLVPREIVARSIASCWRPTSQNCEDMPHW